MKAITHTEQDWEKGKVGGTEEPEIMPSGCVYVKRENSARININRKSADGGFQQNLNLHTHLEDALVECAKSLHALTSYIYTHAL